MKKNWKRMLSLLLTVCMIAGLLVLPAAADEGDEEGGSETPDTYAITVADAENGTVTVEKDGEEVAVAAEGDTLTITATPGEGYALDAITVTGEDGSPVEVTDGVFTMPAGDVTVTVTFKVATTEGGDEDPDDPIAPLTRTVTFEGDNFSIEEIKQGDADLIAADGVYTANQTEAITFKVAAVGDYTITSVEVDGTALIADGDVYTIEAGEGDVTVTITATVKPEDPDPETKEITFDVETGAQITDLTVDDEATTLGSDNKLTVDENATVTFKIMVTNTSKELKDVEGATVGEGGVYTVDDGTETVTITLQDKPATKTDISDKTVTLSKTTDVTVGDTLTASVEGVDAADVDFVWTVGDTEVTANKTATYTVAAADMGKVIKVKAQAKVDSNYEGETAVATATVKGEDTPKTIVYTAPNVTAKYDGQAHKLVVNVTEPATGAVVTYKTTENGGEYIGNNPVFFVPGAAQTVFFKITAEGYEPVESSATVTITKADKPAIKLEADIASVPSAGGEVTFTVTGVPRNSSVVPTLNCDQDGPIPSLTKASEEDHTATFTGTKTIGAADEAKTHTVTLTWVDDNFESIDPTTCTIQQLAPGAVAPATATNLKVSDMVDYAALGVTATAANNKVTYTIDEAALQTAWADAGKKAVITGSSMNHAGVAYLCFTFEAPEGVDNTWKVSQKVNGTLEETKHALNGTDTFDVWTVDGKLVIGDWFGIATIAGDTLTVCDPQSWTGVEYHFFNADDELKSIVTLNVERKVTAAPVEHTVTVNHNDGGEAKASVSKAVAGTEVTLTITPNSGYELAGINVTAISGVPVTVTTDNKFTMPDSDVTVTVTFKPESGEEPTPSGEPFDVVPGNLGQINDDSDLPANGLAEGYTATAVKTAEGAVTVTLKADTLFRHKNGNGVEGFWIGFGMPIEDGKTYSYRLVEDGVDGAPIASVADRVQTVGGKNYNTVYFNLDATDAGKTVTVIIKQTKLEDNTAITYTVNITVDEMTDPLTKALAEALRLRTDVQTSTDGTNISTSNKWVTRDVMDTLDAAYFAAKTVAETSSDMATRVAAAAKLNAAIATFKAAMKDGTQSGGGSGRPNYGSGSSPSNSTTVEKTSETLADGTKRETVTDKDGTVTVTETKPDGTKTVTVTTSDGEITTDVTLGSGVKSATLAVPVKDAGNGTVAIIVKDDGAQEVIRNSRVEDGNVVFDLNQDAKVKVVNNAKKFVDINNHWAKDYVDYVTAREFFNGVDATHFSPDTAMTRAMLATVLYRLVGETSVDGTASYKDVAANTWYTDAVNWASKVGVVNGYPDGTFAPNRSITREELVVMFYRYAGSPAVDDTATLVAYQDADQVSSWAETAMRWAVKNGIINGKSVDTLLPGGNATRAEVSAVLQRYVDLAK